MRRDERRERDRRRGKCANASCCKKEKFIPSTILGHRLQDSTRRRDEHASRHRSERSTADRMDREPQQFTQSDWERTPMRSSYTPMVRSGLTSREGKLRVVC
jgi:hypothetical protein